MNRGMDRLIKVWGPAMAFRPFGKSAYLMNGSGRSVCGSMVCIRAVLLAVSLGIVFGAGCNQAPPVAKVEKKAIEVMVVHPVRDRVTDYNDFTGRLDALKTATLTSRVSGYVDSAPFKEGDHVKEGDVVFTIDPRPYVADLKQAQANLAVAEAESRLQNKNVARAQKLIANRTISQEDFDQINATWEKSKANIESAIATRDKAKLYLDYTKVIAPWSGKISRRNVDPGNMVNADMTQLTTLVSEDSIYAYFDVDERTYLDLMEIGKTNRGSWASQEKYPILMALPKEETYGHVGVVNFVDNKVNSGTGTIRMRGIFDNPDRILKAGMFCRIRLPVGNPYDALLIPDEAIQNDQGKKYVYVLNEKDEVVYRTVNPGQPIQAPKQNLRVILNDGVKPDDRIIVTGLQRIRPGMVVKPNLAPDLKSPGSPLTRILMEMEKPKANPETSPPAKAN